ncbi:MAG: Crp/Fnr family transcriptional regulator, partial [Betaproteobacteria bacterium]|nr:Crp/Fnr family transcriptional regulator [Betaproteobacteria bacterium]
METTFANPQTTTAIPLATLRKTLPRSKQPEANRMAHTEVVNAWRGASDCRSCGVRRIALFGALRMEDFDTFHQVIDDMQFAPGQQLFSEGQR